ncbi:PD-(D/E)XK nuclease family protein [Vibrio parahaemolyticus]|nr:PD-(D/E)XK nuclease family protein [Vibrio parahaemolyticus]
MSHTKIHSLSASLFLTWALHKQITPRIRGIIEHYVHHISVTKYQSLLPAAILSSGVQHQHAAAWFEAENMPAILREAKIALSESDISFTYKDLRLKGRVDQLYKYRDGYILVDTKSHDEVTFRDQLQMSFYALVLYLKGYKLYDIAYIRSVRNGQVSYLEVELIPVEAMKEVLDSVD